MPDSRELSFIKVSPRHNYLKIENNKNSMPNPFEERRKRLEKEATDDIEVDEESDHPIHEKYTKEKKFKS